MPPILTQTVVGNLVTTVVSGLLALFGLPAIVADPPETPPDTPVLWAVLAWVRKEFTETLFNKRPTARPVQTSQTFDGAVYGNINGSDAEGDPLTYRISTRPTNGSVTVNPDGTFTYTPGAALAATGGTDHFYVNVGEANDSSHISGPVGAITRAIRILTLGTVNLDGSRIRVEVTVPAARPPLRFDRNLTIANDISTAAVDSGNRYLYAVSGNSGKESVEVVDLTTDTVVASVPTGDAPVSIALSPDEKTLYVANFNATTLTVIDTVSRTVIDTIDVGVGNPAGLMPSRDGARLYFTAVGGAVYTLDTASRTVTGPSGETGFNQSSATLSPDGQTIYVSFFGARNSNGRGEVKAVSTATGAVLSRIDFGTAFRTRSIAVSQDGGTLYVTNGQTLARIDTAANTVTATTSLGSDVTALTVSPDGRTLLATDAVGTIIAIDTATNLTLGTLYIAPGARGTIFSPDGSTVYTFYGVSRDDYQVAVISAALPVV